MTILIKGMEMPECCRDCELGGVYIHRDANDVYAEEKYRCSVTFYPLKDLTKRHEHCPLIEVPTPHGRLIDADKLDGKIWEQRRNILFMDDTQKADMVLSGLIIAANAIEKSPTVIEAEEVQE